MPEVELSEIELSAGTIEYQDTWGSGPAIVLLHGLIMDGSLWRHVVADLRADYRCVLPTLPLGAHRRPMRADADLSMRGIATLVGELVERLDLRGVTLAMTYGPLSKRPVPREVMDRWFAPAVGQRAIRRDLRKYVLGSAQGRRDLLAASEVLRSFDRPALVAWASEDRLMPREHGRRLAELLPQGRLVEIADSYTLIPEDQPQVLSASIRELLRSCASLSARA
jgi:pimeloyl-ACP methyl ester carboxylesterase